MSEQESRNKVQDLLKVAADELDGINEGMFATALRHIAECNHVRQITLATGKGLREVVVVFETTKVMCTCGEGMPYVTSTPCRVHWPDTNKGEGR